VSTFFQAQIHRVERLIECFGGLESVAQASPIQRVKVLIRTTIDVFSNESAVDGGSVELKLLSDFCLR